MEEKLLLSPRYVIPDKYRDRKVFFLAGPIRGGGAWQMRAAEELWKKYPGCVVSDPTKWEHIHKEASDSNLLHKVEEHKKNMIGTIDLEKYPIQCHWENEYMKMAAKKGALLFWFERESKEFPRSRDMGVYAQDTRIETGIWIERIKNNPDAMVRFGGHWEMNDDNKETKNSFGGMNFITYYITENIDRRGLYEGKIMNKYLIRANSIEEFIRSLEI